MKANFDAWLEAVLEHEGGYVNHPDDPGGATNKGITIGTLKRLGIDVDGDGDSDLADLKALRRSDVARVYRLFYWDAVKGDQLPSGVDVVVADFAVNSGPSRAAKHLQRALLLAEDGDIGPKTLATVAGYNPLRVIDAVSSGRMKFLRGLKTFKTFGKGWTRRVMEVQAMGTGLAGRPLSPTPVDDSPALDTDGKEPHVNETPKNGHDAQDVLSKPGWLAALIAWWFKRNSA